MQCVSYMVK